MKEMNKSIYAKYIHIQQIYDTQTHNRHLYLSTHSDFILRLELQLIFEMLENAIGFFVENHPCCY